MRYTKPALSLVQQIEVLRQRGLLIDDETEAERLLGNIGYFRLAEYWHVMEADKQTHVFKPNVHFQDVITLYKFDAELKILVFSVIQRLEIAMRAKVILYFSMKFGPFWFMDESLADKPVQFEQNLDRLRTELSRSYEDFIKEHFRRYDEPDMPPAWKTLEVASFGTLSKLYRNASDPEVKKQVCHCFDIPAYKFLRSWMKSLTVIRNNCAHHARLWNQRFPFAPQLPQKMPRKWICTHPVATKSLYPNLCCAAYWLNSIQPDNTFVADLKELLRRYPTVNPAAMGFPVDWQNEPLWR
ncbi:MAG: Abi family protein [Bacteroidaceae bacterium]|nr:Abi family protein [Bacteroidaceae bacterium]